MSQYNPLKEGAKAGAAGLTGCLTFIILGLVITAAAIALVAHGVFDSSSPSPSSPNVTRNYDANGQAFTCPPGQVVAVSGESCVTQSGQPARPVPVCRPGFELTTWNTCLDRRHLPCPTGYTGWQNSVEDNCLEKPTP